MGAAWSNSPERAVAREEGTLVTPRLPVSVATAQHLRPTGTDTRREGLPAKMTKMKYCYKSKLEQGQHAKAASPDLRVHYKQMSEVGRAIKGMEIKKAKEYLERVLKKTDVIPYMVHKGGKGRHPQAKMHKTGGSGFPAKASKHMIKLLANLQAGANAKSIESTDQLVLKHVHVNRARIQRRRTYRAHGRISAYVRSPCHVQLVAEPKQKKEVPKPSAMRSRVGERKKLAIVAHLSGVPVGGGLLKAQ